MTFRSRAALVGGTAVGMTVLGTVAVQFWGTGAVDPAGCPPVLARATPSTLDEAAGLIAACSAPTVQARLRGAPLLDLVSFRNRDVPPAAWLASASPLSRQLAGLGFEYPDDMSFAVLSAAWHRSRGLPFDAKATADCLRAWNIKMQQWVQSVAPGSTVPAPEFGCASAEEIEKGRPLWPKE